MPPTSAVLPSAEIATDVPCEGPAVWRSGRWQMLEPVPTSFEPCWVHPPLLRVKTHAPPVALLSDGPPTMAGVPSAEMATDAPWLAAPTAPVPTSFGPCW